VRGKKSQNHHILIFAFQFLAKNILKENKILYFISGLEPDLAKCP
jgi:hypothetical protein